MAACTKCGSVLAEGAVFCTVCGSPVPAAGGREPASGAGMASHVAAALCYPLWLITGVLFLAMEPYKRDPYVRFHAFQSIFFTIVVMVFWAVWNSIIWGLFFPFRFLWPVLNMMSKLISLAIFCYWLFLMYKAYNKERYRIPFIGEFARKQAAK